MSAPLLALGPHIFEIAPLNFQALERQTEALWPTVARFGQAPGRQFVGFGENRVTITGLLRPSEPGGAFLRDNAPEKDRWYSRDVAAIAKARGLDRVAPYFVDAEAPPLAEGGGAGQPVSGLTVIQFRNNHLVYALTWFMLALMVAGGAGYAAREEFRPRRSGDPR